MNAHFRAPQLQSLFAQGKLQEYARGESIGSTHEKDLILLVVRGYIKRYMIRNDGSLGVQIIYGPQDLFSLTRIYNLLLGQSLYKGPETYYYSAICDSAVLSLAPSVLQHGVEENPLLYKELFSEAGQHLKTCVHAIENSSLNNIGVRVAHQLVFLFNEFGEPTPDGARLCLTLTHQDVADMLGVTRAGVTLAIGQLRQKGLLLSDRTFVTPDLESLKKEAYS